MIILYYQGCKFTRQTLINGNLWIILMLGKIEIWVQNSVGSKKDLRKTGASGRWFGQARHIHDPDSAACLIIITFAG